MTFIVTVFKAVLNLIFAFMKLSPVRNKISILSRQSDNKTLDIELLEKEISKQDGTIKVVCLCRTLKPRFKSYIMYLFHLLRQMYHIATSKIVIIDGYCMGISLLKQRKSLTVVQIWHALGSLKKFGYSIFDKEEGRDRKIAELMNMHKNYDIIFSSSKYCVDNFAEAFNYPSEAIHVASLPRVDILTDNYHNENLKIKILEKYPFLGDKKNIVYAPTFRKDNTDGDRAVENLISAIDFSEYNLIIKAHPLMKLNIRREGVLVDNIFSSIDMFSAADFVILDYSAIVYEAAVMRKPLFFYTFDLDKYKDNRDFYIEYEEEMPGIVSQDAECIVNAIINNEYDLTIVREFADKYVEIQENCTYRMARFILNSGK